MRLKVNGATHDLDVNPEVPLLNVLRQDLHQFGAKRGCAQEQCYSCCVLLDGRAVPSCQLPVSAATDMEITTSESLEDLRDFFIAEQAGQCGFCISGMLVATQGLLNQVRYPNDAQIREVLDTNLCRCGVYDRVRRAIRFRIGDPEDSIWELRTQKPLGPRSTPEPRLTQSTIDNPDLDTWVRIDRAETITIFTGKVELGQGIHTALTHIAATELCVDSERILLETVDTARNPDEGRTSGSLSIELGGEAVSAACATARSLLLERAADQLGVPAGALVVADGVISATKVDTSTTYWELHGQIPFQADVDISAERIAVDPQSPAANSRLDLQRKISAEPTYVHDLIDSSTAHGRMLRPPHYDARLASLDTSEAESIAGVIAVVQNGSFVGVVAEREEIADQAIEALRAAAVWEGTSDIPAKTEDLLNQASADYDLLDGTPTSDHLGPLDAHSPRKFDMTATYSKPFTMHASLGPSAAVGLYDGTYLTVWSSTQGPYPLKLSLAQAVGLPAERVRIRAAEGSGCYGHNGSDDVSLDTALLAMAVPNRRVLTAWTRADEHRWEPYGPAMIVKVSGDVSDGQITALDTEHWSYTHSMRPSPTDDGSSNLLAAWHLAEPMTRPVPQPQLHRYGGAHRNADAPYEIDGKTGRVHLVQSRSVRTSALRALGSFTNVFAIESFVDEMAHAQGMNPIQFRLANMTDHRVRGVIEAVDAEPWGPLLPEGQGRGIAFAQYKNTHAYLAAVVEVAVDRTTGVIDIANATLVADAGRIISADGTSNQLEGGAVQAASWTLKEQVQMQPDGVISDDWESYPILRFSESFPIRTILLDRPDQRPLGCGEAAQGPMAAAISNAVFSATGCRLRDLPLTPDRVLEALDKNPTN